MRFPKRLGISPTMNNWLHEQVKNKNVNIVHNHGLWMMPNIYSGRACKDSSCKLVVSPHGTFSTWSLARNYFAKALFWKFLQSGALQRADFFHATCEKEYIDIRNQGFKQPVCILPCGVNIPLLSPKASFKRRQLLFLARIHPTKGVDILLNAWRRVENRFPDWDLYIAGPDNNGYLKEMQLLVTQLRLRRVTFSGPLYGAEKQKAFQNASLYVLPSHTENFGITVAEALAAGTPAIVTRGAPWQGLSKYGAGWWIDSRLDPMVDCLEQALTLSSEKLNEMGKAGHKWIAHDFSWAQISIKFMNTYRWMLQGGEAPPWVRFD